MVTDEQVRILMTSLSRGDTLRISAAKAGMSENTARKYVRTKRAPSQSKRAHDWRTRKDPFEQVWPELAALLGREPSLQAKTLFDYLSQQYPGRFTSGQKRTLERRVKRHRALHGPGQEVFFEQIHEPADLCASDFTHMNSLGVRIGGQAFPHMLYHFVLTYSNWESVSICFSESFQSLSEGLQTALFELGGAPRRHRTDRMGAAVRPLECPDEEFRARYVALLDHYHIKPDTIQPAKANENGDCEQGHRRIKEAIDQALMLRGSRDFASRPEYERFLEELLKKRNLTRCERTREEQRLLAPLPKTRVDSAERLRVRVSRMSMIRVKSNSYMVHSRLIGEMVDVIVNADTIEVIYAGNIVHTLDRVRGRKQGSVNYRFIIDWLVRKPGAFANWRYKKQMFPTTHFKMAHDWLLGNTPAQASRIYTRILYLAATQTEQGVDGALRKLLDAGASISVEAVEEMLKSDTILASPTDVRVCPVDLCLYDRLLAQDKEVGS